MTQSSPESTTEPLRAAGQLDALRALDPDAWDELFRRVRPVLWHFARVRLATIDQAEDAVSETMVRAMAAIGRYRTGQTGLLAWLVGIERNVVREQYRSGARHRTMVTLPEPPQPDASDRLIADEEARSVRRAFAGLSLDDQQLLGLRVVGQLDAAATARALGKRAGAVRTAQGRALVRLRILISAANVDETVAAVA